jgi:hypothetical protein
MAADALGHFSVALEPICHAIDPSLPPKQSGGNASDLKPGRIIPRLMGMRDWIVGWERLQMGGEWWGWEVWLQKCPTYRWEWA